MKNPVLNYLKLLGGLTVRKNSVSRIRGRLGCLILGGKVIIRYPVFLVRESQEGEKEWIF